MLNNSAQNITYLLIGGNLGDRLMLINQTHRLIQQHIGKILESSKIYETQAWGNVDVENDLPNYLNQVLKVVTIFTPEELLQKIHHIEKEMGRERIQRWASRTMDIDILFFNDSVIETKDLSIPHPRIQERNFVLVPLAEIAPKLIHPILQKNAAELLAGSTDTLLVREFKV